MNCLSAINVYAGTYTGRYVFIYPISFASNQFTQCTRFSAISSYKQPCCSTTTAAMIKPNTTHFCGQNLNGFTKAYIAGCRSDCRCI